MRDLLAIAGEIDARTRVRRARLLGSIGTLAILIVVASSSGAWAATAAEALLAIYAGWWSQAQDARRGFVVGVAIAITSTGLLVGAITVYAFAGGADRQEWVAELIPLVALLALGLPVATVIGLQLGGLLRARRHESLSLTTQFKKSPVAGDSLDRLERASHGWADRTVTLRYEMNPKVDELQIQLDAALLHERGYLLVDRKVVRPSGLVVVASLLLQLGATPDSVDVTFSRVPT